MASIRKRETAHGFNYEVDFIDGAGVRRRLRAKTKEAAQQLLVDQVQEARQALPPGVDRDAGLNSYATAWVTAQAAQGLAPGTVASYAQILRLYVLPSLGRERIRDLHRHTIRAWLTHLRQRGLGANTIRLARATLSRLLSDAVEGGILLANPVFGMGRKKKGPHQLTRAEREGKLRPLTEDALYRLLQVAERAEPRIAPVLWTMALAGTRPGEALGVQAGDIDLVHGCLQVKRTVDKVGNVRPPKDGERRTVDLHPQLLPVLKRAIREGKEIALRQGEPWGESRFLFATRTGQPFDLANVAKAFKRALRASTPGGRDPHHSLYDLRHTYATTLLAKRAPINYVAAQMGHANPATTLRYYAHWLPRHGERHVGLLLDAMPPAGVVGLTDGGAQPS